MRQDRCIFCVRRASYTSDTKPGAKSAIEATFVEETLPIRDRSQDLDTFLREQRDEILKRLEDILEVQK